MMLKLARSAVVFALAASCTLALPAFAATPETVEKCLDELQTLVSRAQAADLLDDQVDVAESALSRMEGSCVAAHFDDAMSSAAEVEKIIASNK